MNRRQLLYLATGFFAARSTRAQALPRSGLKHLAAAKGIIYGAECGAWDLAAHPDLARAIVQECAMLVDGSLKWEFTRPAPYTFNFDIPDWRAQFAKRQGLKLRGHTLLWHVNQPQWFYELVNPKNAERVLVEHVQTLTQRYAGQMHSWDVVNEAIEPNDGRSDGLRRSPWLDLLGEDYIDLAFRVAAETDPQALLVYNDYGMEYGNADHEKRRIAILKFLERSLAKGTPIHALGIQSHLVGDQQDFDGDQLQRFLAEVADLGLKILVTELDVIDQKLPADIGLRDRQVAKVYEEYLTAVLQEPAVIAVLQWGLSDRHSWLADFFPRSDGLPVRPLPLDDRLRRKVTWGAIGRAFESATDHRS
jgi:endo-1,4-beta-xylanase